VVASSFLGGLHHEYRLESSGMRSRRKTENDEVFAEHNGFHTFAVDLGRGSTTTERRFSDRIVF
jgi:hypothetical protein